MPGTQDQQELFSIVAVPTTIADKVRAFAASLAEDEKPDAEGYGILRGAACWPVSR